MLNPIPKIEKALELAKKMAAKIYHNANAHEFEQDCILIVGSLQWAIEDLKSNIENDPYKEYLKKLNEGKTNNSAG